MHIPVLLKETVEGLKIKKGDIFLDATLGAGGHSAEVCRMSKGKVALLGIDLDLGAISFVQKMFETDENLKKCKHHFLENSFRNLDSVLDNLKIKKIDKILFDLGMSSNTLETSGRGFSFKKDEPLLMTFSKDSSNNLFTARDVVNLWDEENIADILYGYGEERYARNIAKKIVEKRRKEPIETTFQLTEIISSAIPSSYRRGRKHFAAKTFQAIRIAVNDEVGAIKEGLEKAINVLNKKGRIAVISFHSIEDRAVKNIFKKYKNNGEIKIITKKPIVPDKKEIEINPRSRSSKLRIIEKI